MSFGIKDYALFTLAAALALVTWLYRSQGEDLDAARLDTGIARIETANALITAKVCGESVLRLKKDQEDREAAAKPAVDASKEKAVTQTAKAQTILTTAPTKPGNDCGSAKDRASTWLTGRTK